MDAGRSPPSSAKRRDHLRACENELMLLENALCAGRRIRNKLVPACSLPSEILSYIFALVRQTWETARIRRDDEDGYIYELNWILVTHVCSLWREVNRRIYEANAR